MINNIYELSNGRQYLVIKEKDLGNTKYVLVAECNFEKDLVKEDEVLLKKVYEKNGNILFDNLTEEEASNVMPQIISLD